MSRLNWMRHCHPMIPSKTVIFLTRNELRNCINYCQMKVPLSFINRSYRVSLSKCRWDSFISNWTLRRSMSRDDHKQPLSFEQPAQTIYHPLSIYTLMQFLRHLRCHVPPHRLINPILKIQLATLITAENALRRINLRTIRRLVDYPKTKVDSRGASVVNLDNWIVRSIEEEEEAKNTIRFIAWVCSTGICVSSWVE